MKNDNSLVSVATTATSIQDIVIGNGAYDNTANATNGRNIIIGSNAGMTGGEWNIVIGRNAISKKGGQVTIGNGADNGSGQGIAIGTNALTGGLDESMAIGLNANSQGNAGAIAFGRDTNSQGGYSLAIGRACTVNSTAGLTIGTFSSNTATGSSVVVGHSISCAGSESIVIGNTGATCNSAGSRSIAMGRTATVAANNSLAIGNYATIVAGASNSMSFTSCAVNVNEQRAVGGLMIVPGNYGCTTAAAATNSIVLGGASSQIERASNTGSIAIGYNTQANANNAVALGAGVVASTADTVTIKKLQMLDYATLNYADDTAAAAGGIPLGGVYHTAGVLKIRTA
jgi:hypothetical protein